MSKKVQFPYNLLINDIANTVLTYQLSGGAKALISGSGWYPRTSVVVIEYEKYEDD